MTNEIPSALEAYHPGVVHICQGCGCSVVDAVLTPGRALPLCGLPGPGAGPRGRAHPGGPGGSGAPTICRTTGPRSGGLITVIAFAVVALAIVFWKR